MTHPWWEIEFFYLTQKLLEGQKLEKLFLKKFFELQKFILALKIFLNIFFLWATFQSRIVLGKYDWKSTWLVIVSFDVQSNA